MRLCACVYVCREENTYTTNRTSQKGILTFSVFAEDVSNNREILPDIIVFVMRGAFY